MAVGTSDIGTFGYVHLHKSDEHPAIELQIFLGSLYVTDKIIFIKTVLTVYILRQ